MHSAEVTAIGEAQDTLVQFECHVDVNAGFAVVGSFEQLLRVCKPKPLTIQAEVHGEHAAVEREKHKFAFAVHGSNATALG